MSAIDKDTYFEVAIDYGNGVVQQLFATSVDIQSETLDNGWEPNLFDRDRYDYYHEPRTTEIKYRNIWGANTIVEVPRNAQVHWRIWRGDVFWLEEGGKRVSPIMDQASEVFVEKAKYPTAEVQVREFKPVEGAE